MATALTQTTLSAAATANASVINVASATGITAPSNNFMQKLYVINPNQTRGEIMTVVSVSGTAVSVSRLDEFRQGFLSGAIVIIIPVDAQLGNGLHEFNQQGAPPSTSTPTYTPFINGVTGEQWLFSSVTNSWVPGWNMPGPFGPTAAVASAAGSIIPSGPLFHITGTAAITGFTNASMIGFTGGSFTVIPDAVFTWTAAGNIGLAGTAVVGKALTFTWDSNAAKWYPSYIA